MSLVWMCAFRRATQELSRVKTREALFSSRNRPRTITDLDGVGEVILKDLLCWFSNVCMVFK